MRYDHKFTIVFFLSISLVIWHAPSEARRGHSRSHDHGYFDPGHRFHKHHAFHVRHHFYHPHHFPRQHFRGYHHHYHRSHDEGCGYHDHSDIDLHFHNALEYSRIDETTTWQNPDIGGSETLTPYHTYRTKEGRYCREFIKTVTIGGERHQAYGTACRQPDGNWEVIGR